MPQVGMSLAIYYFHDALRKMTSRSDAGDEQLRLGSRLLPSDSLTDNLPTRSTFCRSLECGTQVQGDGDTLEPEDRPSQHVVSCAATPGDREEAVVTGTCETEITLDLGRVPEQDTENGERPGQANEQSPMQDANSWDVSDHLLHRFEQLGDVADLQEGITILRESIKSTPISDERYRAGLVSLGLALQTRFNLLGESRDIQDAISTLKDAVDLLPHAHSDKPTCLSCLGDCLIDRFEHFGEPVDLEEAISTLRDAVNLTPLDHSDRPGHLNNLGNSFLTRFERFGELCDLEDALSSHKDAVRLTADGHPDKPIFLSSLGNSFLIRFMRSGELSDLEDAVSRHRDVVDLIPRGHPDKPGHLNNLGNSLVARFERLGDLNALEDAISMFRDAVDLTPHGHPQKPRRLENLGNSLKSRFKRLGGLGDLRDAISLLRDAADLTPYAHPERHSRLINLGNTFYIRFLHFGELSDLEDAVSQHKDAVSLTPNDHPDKPISLNSLATSLLARFERLWNTTDLVDAVSIFRDAVDLIPHDHTSRPAFLSNLGNSLLTRFVQRGELSDLEIAILSQWEAISLTSQGHPDEATYLGNLGHCLFIRFQHIGMLYDLEHAISRQRDAVDLTPDGHPDRPGYLNSLGTFLRVRFRRLGELNDLEAAISALRDAVDYTPRSHLHKPAHLDNLGKCLVTRYECFGGQSDIEEAISRLTQAVDLTPRNHPHRPGHLDNLGDAFRARFEYLVVLRDIERAISIYSHAAFIPIGPIGVRFHAAQKWISSVRRIHHHSLLHAYSVIIGLLPRLAWIGLSLAQRYIALAKGADVVREAAAAALDAGFPETAVVWLEQGRSIVWGEMFQLRNSPEQLSSAYPDHAHRLRYLSAALEDAGGTREYSAFVAVTQNSQQHATEALKRESDGHHRLVIEREKLLQEIRELPGFERFLLHKKFSQIRASTHAGPVVILNAARSRCDALIVAANVDHVIHVPLPKFTVERSTNLQKHLKSFVRCARSQHSDEREGQSAPLYRMGWESLLPPLWKCVVHPVLDALAFSIPGDLSRIFWCPTGPFMFLPLHAAGLYDREYSQPGHKVFDFVVSSYVPTLSVLAQSPYSAAIPNGNLRLLAVGQPSTDGLPYLPGVATELAYIREAVQSSSPTRTTLLQASVGTVEEVLTMMKETDWIHLACHGIQDSTDSGLCLANGRRLKLRDMIALSRPRGGFAFLSACQTAKGHERLPDEAIHIAAGMLFAGYESVIGTMWSISDKLAPIVARDVYGQLFQSGSQPDYRDAARALHDAIGRLRESGEVSFGEWIPFIHLGL